MCLEKPGPRCSGHTRINFVKAKAALKEANADLEQKKQELEVAQSAEAKAALEASEKAHAVAVAELNTATAKYDESKAKRAVAMEAYRTAKDEYNASPEGIKKNRQRSVDKKLTDEQREEARTAAIEGNATRNRQKEAYAFKKALDEAEKTAVEAETNEALKAEKSGPQVRSEYDDLASSTNIVDRVTCAGREACPSHILDALSQDDEAQVRYTVAGNEHTPKEALKKLASDTAMGGAIAEQVATNPNTPGDVLSEMTGRNWRIRFTAVTHPSLPQDDMLRLSSQEHSWAHTYLADNPSTPPEALHNLAQSDELHVVQQVAAHKNTSDDSLLILAKHKTMKVREAVADHPNTSPETLRALVKGKGASVLWSVTSNPKTPKDALESIAAMPPKGAYDDIVWRASHALRTRKFS